MYNIKRKRLCAIIALTFFYTLIITIPGCGPKEILYTPGTYYNQAEGYYSILLVEVTVDAYNIVDITILENEEPVILSEIVFEELPPRIIKRNSTDVDVISGATITSSALLHAVENALKQAREDIE